ncbi:hypothetical protein MUP77_23820 [Candidatus Bathyarchaeota archaeon]|nr:hypothetical protein [Candidatus Bathyarchaeota archaeon]
MAILKKAEFEKEIKEAIEKATSLYVDVKVKKQAIDRHGPTTVFLEVEICINGLIEDLSEGDACVY